MNLVIISAFKASETLLNSYRHKLLKNYLKAEGYNVLDGTGKAEGQEEPLCIIKFDREIQDDEINMLETLALLFEQEYYIVVENDTAYKYADGYIQTLGIFWEYNAHCPPSVGRSINDAFTRIDDEGTYYGIQTPEMAKADAFTAAELQADQVSGYYTAHEAPRARSFIYGTPEWLERQAHTARTIKY